MATAVLRSQPSIIPLFLKRLSLARDRVLFLDYDGTVAPFTVLREQAFPYAQVPELIDSILHTCRTRVVLISGRSALDIPPLLRPIPGLEIWGAHGLERLRPNGEFDVFPISDQAASAIAEAEARVNAEGLSDFCERKRGALAIHWRGMQPEYAVDVSTAAYRAFAAVACKAGFRLAEFDGGLELRLPAGNKAYAVRTVFSEVADDAVVAYLGDDVTDEDAFHLVNARGLSVLVRPVIRYTNAQCWIKPPRELIQFLLDWICACQGDV